MVQRHSYGRTRSGDTELMSTGEIPHTNISRADFDTIEGSETIEPLSAQPSAPTPSPPPTATPALI
jgi:hypothetical protein